MKTKKIVWYVLVFGTVSFSVGVVAAVDVPVRGPIPLEVWDVDASGTIEASEFNAVCEQRQALMQSRGARGRNLGCAPVFAQIDSNTDGKISKEELSAKQDKKWNNRRMAKNSIGARCVWQPSRMMSAEIKAKYDDFYQETTAVRKAVAVKRAEKRAIVRSGNRDTARVAQLAGELFDLRNGLMLKANEAGLQLADFGRGGTCYGGRGRGGAARW